MLIGSELRKKNRKHKKELTFKKSELAFYRIFGDRKNPISLINFEKNWADFLSELEMVCKNRNDYISTHNYFIKELEKRTDTNEKPMEPSSVIVKYEEKAPLRSKEWMRAAWKIDDFHSEWFRDIGKKNKLNTLDELYQALMISFICHSGHANPDYVIAFNIFLQQDEFTLFNMYDLPCISLTINSEQYHTNVYIDSEAMTVQNCYLSYLTMALLEKWRRFDKENWVPPKDKIQIYRKICPIGLIKEYGLPKTLHRFCNSAIYVTQKLTKKPLNEGIVHFALGRVKSYSLPASNYLVRSNVNTSIKEEFYKTSDSQGINGNVKKIHQTPTNGFYKDLNKILDGKSEVALTKSLVDLLKKDLALQEQLLVEWLFEKKESCNPLTLRGYFNLLACSWLKVSREEDFFALDADEIDSVYGKEMELINTKKQQVKFSKLLSSIHSFTAKKGHLPNLSFNSSLSGSVKGHVRAAFVEERLFKGLLDSCLIITDITSEEQIALQCIYILSYRGGLRLTEARSRLFYDIEKSNDMWVKVSSNKYAKLKSDKSKRKVPLKALLLAHEEEIILKHFKNIGASIKGQNGGELLFTFGSNQDQLISASFISSYTSRILRKLSGCNYFVFHHLRHSALSRLQLLESMEKIEYLSLKIQCLVPYSFEKRNKILKNICGKNSKNRFEGIAKFAGHSSPDVTFKSYFHFCDYILGERCAELDITLKQHQANCFGLGSRQVCAKLAHTIGHIEPHHFKKYLFWKCELKDLGKNKIMTGEEKTIEYKQKQSKSMVSCHRALSKVQEGYELQSIAVEFGIDISLLNKWCNKACYVRDKFILKAKDKPFYVKFDDRKNLLPSKLRRKSEQKYFDSLIRKISSHFKEKHSVYAYMLRYTINNICNENSGIEFKNPNELSKFINELKPVINLSQWRVITYRIEHSKYEKQWSNTLSPIENVISRIKGSATGRVGYGKVVLELIAPDEAALIANSQQKRYSTSLFLYLVRMHCIMIEQVLGKVDVTKKISTQQYITDL